MSSANLDPDPYSQSSVGGAVSRSGGRKVSCAYHGLVGELLDLLDGTGSPLLEGDTVQLFHARLSAIRRPVHQVLPIVLAIAFFSAVGLGKRTLLWRWMVYSRATTSLRADRVVLPDFLVDDISANGQNFVRAVILSLETVTR